ncbi:unnamed protein product, partial [Allacma fusca]
FAYNVSNNAKPDKGMGRKGEDATRA